MPTCLLIWGLSLNELLNEWLEAKEQECQATERRRAAEDALIMHFKQIEGIQTAEFGPYQVKVSSRYNRKVDAEKLHELAAEAGLTEHLHDLFRFKPELNLGAWRNADPSITTPLLGAITTEPGRPSFKITIKED